MRRRRCAVLLLLGIVLVYSPASVEAGGGEVLISFPDAQHGWVGFPGRASTRLLATADGGRTWRVGGAPIIGIEIHFADRLHGWADGETPQCATTPPPACHNILLATSDGG